MANISEEVYFEMLEKKADGTFKAKYPKVKSKSGITFDEHLAEKVHQGEIHGLKLNTEKELEYFDGVEWKASDWKNIDLNTWAGVQAVVRAGQAHKYFQVGDQLVSAYDGGEITWEVIGLNVDTPADSNFVHSMTIQTKDCLHNIQFDAPEPNNPDSNRKSYGNNRYIHSAVRQWLNSNESKFNWKSQHQYDAEPTDSLDLYNGAGFLYRLDPELVSVIGLVNKRVARNTSVDGGGQDTFTDKVFLLSRVEAGLGTEGDETGEFIYPFYDGIADAGRIKQLNGSNRTWWLRSPVVSYSSHVRLVNTYGSLLTSNANNANGVSPACVII